MSRRGALAGIAGLMLVVALTACSSTAPRSDPVTAPPGSEAPTSSSLTASGTRPWWIAGGAVTPGEVRPDGLDPVRGALDALLAGPNPAEAAFGAGTGLPKGVVVNSLTVGPDGIATVDFNRTFETRDTRPQVAQVVYTLTQFPQVTKVRFLIEGQPNGATGVPPVGRNDLSFPAAP